MKRLIIATLLFFSMNNSFAQGICDSTIYINPIEDICSEPYNLIYLTASHPGGVFIGPFVSSIGIISTEYLTPGIHTVTYTITTEDCSISTEQNFTVLDRPEGDAWSEGTLDCTDPQSTPIQLFSVYDGDAFTYWNGPNGYLSYEENPIINAAGTYTFVIDDPVNFACPRYIPVVVDQIGENNVNIINCSDCSGNFLLLSVDMPSNLSLGWFNLTTGESYGSGSCFFVPSTGWWQVFVSDPNTGCTSTDFIYVPSTLDSNPSVNAGGGQSMPCHGATTQLNGAYNYSDWEMEVEWTTDDGSFIGNPDTIDPYIDSPGTYYLTVTNPSTGCSDTDFVVVGELPITTFINDTICAGLLSAGYSETGTYIDTFPTNWGCDSIRVLDLIVYEPTIISASVIADNGMGNGAVILEITGEAPFIFEWSNGETGTEPFLSGLTEGVHTVTVTSVNDCSTIFIFYIPLDPETGGATSEVNGVVFFDENNNCIYDVGELTLSGVHVALSDEEIFAQNSNLLGEYNFPMSTGDYYLTATPPSSIWMPCIDSIPVSIENDFDTLTVNYPMQAVVYSPVLNVEIAASSLTRCFENTYVILYENNGTATAEDAFVEVLFDIDLDIISSSLPWSSIDGNTYTFDIGDIGVGESGQFSVVVIPNCNTTSLGDIICVEAHIFPDTLPMLMVNGWNGALITVEGECVDGDLNFQIKNIGEGNMTESNTYIVIEDAILNNTDQFQLNSGDSVNVVIEGNGSTFWLKAEQVENAPTNLFPGYAIEGCADGEVTAFSTGYMNDFMYNDLGQVVDVDCKQVVGSYDPNQKSAFPKGFTDNHYIEPNVPIEYVIEFQNTGTAPAVKVEIVDILSEHLDLTSLEVLHSSHHYNYRLVPGNKLTFTFDDINLPDSTTNLLASQGFVKFKISPKKDLPAGTVIENDAAIYFDFNEPIITNQTFHTIWEGSVFQVLTAIDYVDKTAVVMNIFPNPFAQSATVELEGAVEGVVYFQLYDVLGKVVYEKTSYDSTFDIQPNDLTKGIYFFTIKNKEQNIGNGKVMIK